MLSLRKPNADAIREFLESQRAETLSYREVAATNGSLPSGYSINHTRRKLGQGRPVFDSACAALRQWHQLRLGWVDCWPHNAPLETGEMIAVIGRAFGLWWLNACRIVYVIDTTQGFDLRHSADSSRDLRFGYAHGTLPAHIASGEERFLIEMDSEQNVWLDILAFSRPNTLLARIGYPIMQREQRRFGRESAAKLLQLIGETQNRVRTEPALHASMTSAL